MDTNVEKDLAKRKVYSKMDNSSKVSRDRGQCLHSLFTYSMPWKEVSEVIGRHLKRHC